MCVYIKTYTQNCKGITERLYHRHILGNTGELQLSRIFRYHFPMRRELDVIKKKLIKI